MNVFYCPGLSLWLTTLICRHILHTNEVERNLKTVSLSQKWPKNHGGLQQKPAWVSQASLIPFRYFQSSCSAF